MSKLQQVAVIDIGSNTVRLVIYRINQVYDFHELQNVKLPIRLYQYLDKKNQLQKKGIDSLIEVIRLFQTIMKHYQLDDVIPVATAVIRQAENQEDILKTVKEKTGMALRLLSDEEEARYGQYAIARSTQFNEGYTIDMGGGSTEVTYFKNGVIQQYHSFHFGVVTLKSLFYDAESDNQKANEKARSYIQKQFDTQDWLKKRNLPVISIGGSSRNIASVHQRLHDYPMAGSHEYKMHLDDLKETASLFTRLTFSEMQDLDGLSRDRADIILPANVNYIALYEAMGANELIFCHLGLREGLLMERINREQNGTYTPNNVRQGTLDRLAALYLVDAKAVEQRQKIANQLLAQLAKGNLFFPNRTTNNYLKYGTSLYHIGAYVDEDDSSMHSFYLLTNSNLNGFSHKERLALALIASYKNKSLFNQFLSQYLGWLSDEELQSVREIGSLLKFCDSLAITKVNEIIDIDLKKAKKNLLELKIVWKYPPLAEYYRAMRQKKNLEYVLGTNLTIDFQQETKR